MIFITVGTHEQQFNRLLEKINELKTEKKLKEEVVIQSGYSDYIADSCYFKNIMSFTEMTNYIKDARIVITHGGPGSIFSVINQGKIPVVVPRNPLYGEHVDNHQMEFVKRMVEQKKVIGVFEVEEILHNIENYENKASKLILSNQNQLNNNFVGEFSKIIKSLF
ncbi:glycosyltransferase [Peribacillus simplex]|uniref:glycosyltransferase n=1 Tax=Peribacillus simplex TaxID=1478 RepID=UPI003CF715F5